MQQKKRLRKKSNIPDGLSAVAKREREIFLKRCDDFAKRCNSIALSVLVWGQNPKSETRVGRKRREIRQELLNRGHNAMFSEELLEEGDSRSLKVKEWAQAKAAHVIIALVEDSGALGETHDFGSDPEVAHKFFVLAPVELKQGYSGHGVLHDLTILGNCYWYEQGELEACNVLESAVTRVETIRNLWFFSTPAGRL